MLKQEVITLPDLIDTLGPRPYPMKESMREYLDELESWMKEQKENPKPVEEKKVEEKKPDPVTTESEEEEDKKKDK